MSRKSPAPPCPICAAPIVAHGYCDKHYRRWKKYGTPKGGLRPADWGDREKHPLYGRWAYMVRHGGRDQAWGDFWAFVADLVAIPDGFVLARRDRKKPWGPENYFLKAAGVGPGEEKAKRNAYAAEWRKRNPARVKEYCLRNQYGMTLAEYDAMLDAQGEKCAICGTKPETALAVDHCHNSKKVRGLLCHSCNRGLGLFNDSKERLLSALDYLRAAKGQSAKG